MTGYMAARKDNDGNRDENTLSQLSKVLNQQLDSQQQQYGTYFKPDVKLCLVIGNHDYSIVRDRCGNGFADLRGAEKDADIFEKNILQCGFDQNNVTKLKNVNFNQIKNQLTKYRRVLSDGSDAKKNTLLVIYYAGHGVMLRNENNIVVLENDKNKQLYRLEF